jgi:hypothetical protein
MQRSGRGGNSALRTPHSALRTQIAGNTISKVVPNEGSLRA